MKDNCPVGAKSRLLRLILVLLILFFVVIPILRWVSGCWDMFAIIVIAALIVTWATERNQDGKKKDACPVKATSKIGKFFLYLLLLGILFVVIVAVINFLSEFGLIAAIIIFMMLAATQALR